MAGREARLQEGCRHHVAQAQHRIVGRGVQRHVDRVRVATEAAVGLEQRDVGVVSQMPGGGQARDARADDGDLGTAAGDHHIAGLDGTAHLGEGSVRGPGPDGHQDRLVVAQHTDEARGEGLATRLAAARADRVLRLTPSGVFPSA